MPLALQAALGFVQAIHYSAKAATVNRECCCGLSRLIGKIRPLLEEVEFESKDDATGMRDVALESIATALEKAHVAVVRFSTMGHLQAILETEAMMSQFQVVCFELDASLSALHDAHTTAPPEWKEDMKRISGQLLSVSFESCSENSNTLRQLRQEVVRMNGVSTVSKAVHSQICNLLWRCQLPDKLDMVVELQGLRRELSRAKAEKNCAEEFLLQQVIKALQSSAAVPYTPSARLPQPPVEYCCPISHQVMRDPVVLVETGQTYDRKCIEEWFVRGNVTCPVTGQRVNSVQLTPNFALKSLASTWVEVHGYEEVSMQEDMYEEGLVANSATNPESELPPAVKLASVAAQGDEKKQEGQGSCGDHKAVVEGSVGAEIGAHHMQVQERDPSAMVDGLFRKAATESKPSTLQGGKDQRAGGGKRNKSPLSEKLDVGAVHRHTELLSRMKGLLDRVKQRRVLDVPDGRSSTATPDSKNDSGTVPVDGSATCKDILAMPSVTSYPFSGSGQPSGSDCELAVEQPGTSDSDAESMKTSIVVPDANDDVEMASIGNSPLAALPSPGSRIVSFPVAFSMDSETDSVDEQDSTSGSDPYPDVVVVDDASMGSAKSAQSDIAEGQDSGFPSPAASPLPQAATEQMHTSPMSMTGPSENDFAGSVVQPTVPRLDLAPVLETRARTMPPPQDGSWAAPDPTGRTTPEFSDLNTSDRAGDLLSRRSVSASGAQSEAERKASGRAGHVRRYSWSGEGPDVSEALSKFQQARQAAVSTQGRLQLLALAVNTSRQRHDFPTPQSSQRTVKSDEQFTSRTSLVDGASGIGEMHAKGLLASTASPPAVQDVMAASGTADISNIVNKARDGKLEAIDKRAEIGAVNPLSRWLDLCPESLVSDDETGASDSEGSEPESLDISQLLQCPFSRDLDEVASATGSGVFQSSDWDGMSLGSDDESEEGDLGSAAGDDDALSTGRHSISSLTTVASGGLDIVPVAMEPLRAKRGTSPCPSWGAPPGSPDMGLDGDADKVANHTTPVLLKLLASGSLEVAMATAVELAEKAKKKPSVRRQLLQSGMIPSLVHMLQSPKRDVRIASARALALLGDSSTDLQLEIIAAGAVPLLSRLTRAGSRKSGEAAGWAMNRLTAKPAPASSVASTDVSVPLLVDLLCTGNADMKASAVLELSRTVARTFGGYEEVARPGVVEALVELLSNEISAVHRAAGDLLASLLYKNKGALQVLADKDGIVPHLLNVIKTATNDGKTAAAQVLKGLADVSKKVQQDVVDNKGISTLAMFLKVGLPGNGGREASAWMLGSLACHSNVAREQVLRSGVPATLESLLREGEAEEKTAAAWSLRQLSQEDDDDLTNLALPLIVRSLESGPPEVQVVAACELCHFACGSFWTHLELFHADALSALLGFLRRGGPTEGLNAALAALLHLGNALDTVPGEICQQGGIEVLVDNLKPDCTADGKLVAELLSLLSERCPMHQQEIVSAGGVPLLVDMLPKSDACCAAARNLLMALVDSELSAISLAASHTAIPLLLGVMKSGGSVRSREAAVALINRMVEINVETRQTVAQSGGTPILLQAVNHGESHELKSVAANAMTKLAACNGNVQESLVGSGAFGSLVQLLESTSTRIRQQAAERAKAMGGDDKGDKSQPRLDLTSNEMLVSARGRKGGVLSTIEETKPLVVVPSAGKLRTRTLAGAASDSAAGSAQGVVGGVMCDNESHGPDGKSGMPTGVVGSKPQDVAERLTKGEHGDGTGHAAGHMAEEGSEHAQGFGDPTSQKGGRVSELMDALRRGDGQDAAKAALRSLAVGNKAKRMELLHAGAVPLLVEILQSKSYH
eukprot:evm.model.scf_26.16 EVM.evm.TU.scf_26.16   scf_26:134044-140940(-)